MRSSYTFGGLSVAAVAVAGLLGNTGLAGAQDPWSDVQPTVCGAGVINDCGFKATFHCELVWVFDLSLFLKSGTIGYYKQNCVKDGEIRIYKDSPGGACHVQPDFGNPDNPQVPGDDEPSCD